MFLVDSSGIAISRAGYLTVNFLTLITVSPRKTSEALTSYSPFMTGIVSSSIAGFIALKISATFLIGFTYIYAKRMLNRSIDKNTRGFKISSNVMKLAYAGIMIFLVLTVINNLLVLMA